MAGTQPFCFEANKNETLKKKYKSEDLHNSYTFETNALQERIGLSPMRASAPPAFMSSIC